MGIRGLAKLIEEVAPAAVSKRLIQHYCNKVIAIDASVMLYQFITTITSGDGAALANSSGEVTSHLVGLLAKVIRMAEAGIKPIFVFDGKPPEDKQGELEKRRQAREAAELEQQKAEEEGNLERAKQLSRRTVKVTQQHCKQAERLLDVLGIPYIIAAGEAEAQCVAMAKERLCEGVASSDLDVLAFGSPCLIRNLAQGGDREIMEINLNIVLKELGFSYDEFLDLCILCGCDYANSLEGIGPKTAYKLIVKHRSIEEVLAADQGKLAEKALNWPYVRARELFKNPEIIDPKEIKKTLKWKPVNRSEAMQFLVEEMEFDREATEKKLDKLVAARKRPKQCTIDSFFSARSSDSEVIKTKVKQ
ncbi:Flap structure-specific endonuclease [Giardia lamblia P15]|uniref:Flap endonuclease 1 n=1 Tax=Giardia intestinalis (strain P15) TaxID=658858 RepID=E1F5K1_GIAIA|nr:Flap structure-specific endonuclease [Giardia lamblia P15]